ncbi:MAG: STAS domain-containing protein [Bacteroidota bacterium]
MPLHLIHMAEYDITIIEPDTDLLGGPETEELRTTISKLNEKGNLKLVVDLSKVSYLNSFALGVLTTACVKYNQRGGSIVLCGLNPNVMNVFHATRLTMVFKIYTDQDEAIDHLIN